MSKPYKEWTVLPHESMVEVSEDGDRPALRAQLEEWSGVDGLDRIIVSHGDIVSGRPRETLHRLADALAG